MYYQYEIPDEVNKLKFSVWNKNEEYGHVLFVGNLVEISHFLENNDIKNLEVSALDLLAMQSHDPIAADQWLNWYYSSALSAIEKSNCTNLFSDADIQQALNSYILPTYSGIITIGLN